MTGKVTSMLVAGFSAFGLMTAPVVAGPGHDHEHDKAHKEGKAHSHDEKAHKHGDGEAHSHAEGDDHQHEPKAVGKEPGRKLNEKGILLSSGTAVKMLVRQALPVEGGLLDESWEAVSADNRQIHRQGNGYYIVAVKKSDEEDGTLYLLLSDKGELYDANYKGTFEGLKE